MTAWTATRPSPEGGEVSESSMTFYRLCVWRAERGQLADSNPDLPDHLPHVTQAAFDAVAHRSYTSMRATWRGVDCSDVQTLIGRAVVRGQLAAVMELEPLLRWCHTNTVLGDVIELVPVNDVPATVQEANDRHEPSAPAVVDVHLPEFAGSESSG